MKVSYEDRMRELEKVWNIFSQDGFLVIMTFNTSPRLIGCFSDKEQLARSIKEKELVQFYTVLHKVKKEKLKSLPQNKLDVLKSGSGISSEDISRYRFLFIDIDVCNLKGNSSESKKRNATYEENQKACDIAGEITEYLREKGFPEPFIINSGNGFHVLFRIQGTPSKSFDDTIKDFLKALSLKWKDDNIRVDTVVSDRARKIKLPGSWNGKSKLNKRLSRIKNIPVESEIVPLDKLQEVASEGKNTTGWKGSQEEKMSDEERILVLVESKAEYFFSTNKQVFATMKEHNGRTVTYLVSSLEFEMRMRLLFLDELSIKVMKPDMWKKIVSYINTLAYRSGIEKEVSNRIASEKHTIYYDLQNDDYECVMINDEGYEIVPVPDGMFYRMGMDVPQCAPKWNEKFDFLGELAKIFNFEKKSLELFGIWLINCFIPQSPTPLLLLTGPQGTGKSTCSEQIAELVSPQQLKRCALPTKTDDLVTLIVNRCITVLDNASFLNKQSSDALCQTVTGGTYAKRSLYSNGELYSVPMKSAIVINGIDNVVTKGDLLSRALIFNLVKIDNGKIQTDEQLKKQFEKKKPYFLGSIFNIISYVLEDIDSIEDSDYVIRLAGFQNMAIKIGRVLLNKDSKYIKELLKANKAEADMQAVESNPLAVLIREYMEKRKRWKGSVMEFYNQLRDFAEEKDLNNSTFPKSPSSLSRNLNNLSTTLEKTGITFINKNNGKYKELEIINCTYTERERSRYRREI